jgi:hypothetical protein
MRKKIGKLHRLANRLASRYGEDDPDVLRLRAELNAFNEKPTVDVDRRAYCKERLDFRSVTRQLYHATLKGDTHHHR